MAEKVLGELYAWDSAIEDDFARPEGERDEDRALESYEEIIMAAGATEGDEAADQVLSLAAMLLTKHFFRFPHVQLNVVNALLGLCGASRAQAVRIHSVRSLLSIVKTPAHDFVVPDVDNAIAWVQRIDDVVAAMRADEASSSVLLRQISPLADALKVTMDMLQTRKHGDNQDANSQAKPENDDRDADVERAAKKPKLSPADEPMSPASGHHGNENASYNKREDEGTTSREWVKPQRDQNDSYSRPFERKSAFSTSCPPGPHVFIGNIPTSVTPTDMLEFLSEVLPELTLPCVQVKTNHSNTSSYAFISTDSVDMARKVIRFLSTTRYLDRKLNGRFARGPPVNTLTFVERTDDGNLTSEADIQTREFDFDNCDGNVWGKLMAQMERIGEFEVVARGRIRFFRTDDAKQAVQKHVFHVLGYEVIPIYEAEEQSAADAARRARETKQPFTLKSGRQVGEREFRSENYGGGRYDDNRRDNDDRRGPNDNYRSRRDSYQKAPASPRAEYSTRSPSPKPNWRNSGPRQRDSFPPSNQESARRARSPGFRPHSPTPAASHRSRSPPRAQGGRSRSPVDDRRYDGPSERRSSRTNSPGAPPPNQRGFPANQRRDRSPPRSYADEPEPKSRDSAFQPREDRGRPREREQYSNRSRGPDDFRNDRAAQNTRGDGPPRYESGPPSGYKRDSNRFNPRNDGSPFRNSPVSYRNQAPREPVDQRRSRSRSRSPPPMPKFGGSRPPPPEQGIRQSRPDDRREMRDSREDKPAWRDNRKREFRSNEHDDRTFVREDRFSKRDDLPSDSRPNVRDDQSFDRDGPSGRPFKNYDRPFKPNDRPPFKPNNDRPFKNFDRPFKPNDRPFKPNDRPFKPNDRSFGRDDGRDDHSDKRDFRSGPPGPRGDDRPGGRDYPPVPRHDRDDRPPTRDDYPMDQDNSRGRDNRPLWRNKGPSDRPFGRNSQRPGQRDNGESDEGVARYGAPSGDRRSRSPPRQNERRPSSSGHSSPRNDQSRTFEPRERRTPSQFSNKSDNFRGEAPRENRQYSKPSPHGSKASPRGSFRGSPIQTREPSVDERSSKSHTPRESRSKHSSRKDRDEDRRREGKRSRNDDLSSPVASKRARSMSPSPARKSASVAGSERGKTSARPTKSADDPFDGMDELTVDYEEDD